MALMNELKGGADLTKPHLSVGYAVSATVAIIILAVVVGVALWLYNKGKSAVTGVTGGSELRANDPFAGW